MDITQNTVSAWIVYPTIGFFIFLGGISLYVSIDTIYHLWDSIDPEVKTIVIDKGNFYLFGVGLTSFMLVFDGVYTRILNKNMPQKLYKIVSYAMVTGVIIAVVLPHIIHYPLAEYLEESGYQVCESRSSQWLFVRKIVYTLPGSCD